MIREWLTYLRTRCAPAARSLGYLHEVIAIRGRHERNRDAWAPHLRQCREFILAAARQCEAREHCAVLGSGLLLDVPVDELAAQFRTVELVDIVHLPETRRAVRHLDNVRLVEADLTGLAEKLTDRSDLAHGHTLPAPHPPAKLFAQTPDLIVSLNLLSQLPLNPVLAARERGHASRTELHDWAREIQRSHWEWLAANGRRRVVISDRHHTTVNRDGKATGETRLNHLPDLPDPDANWPWQLAPFGEIDGATRIQATVDAWTLGDAPLGHQTAGDVQNHPNP